MLPNKRGDAVFAVLTFAVIIGMLGYLFWPRRPASPPEADRAPVPAPREAVVSQDDGAWCDEAPDGRCMSGICGAAERTIVVFHAEWCGWCRQLQETTLRDARVRDALASYGRILVDIDRNGELADRYNVDGVPCLVFFGPECNEVGRIPGYIDADRLLEELDHVQR